MTYLGFHAVFTLPLLLALALWPPRPIARDRQARRALGLLVVIAFVYTTPWDNYLVFREVWGYPPDRVLARIGYVPIEEYMFFVIQTLMTGLWYLHLRHRWSKRPLDRPLSETARWLGTAFFAGVSILGLVFVFASPDQALYMGLIIAWAGPILTMMWAIGGHWIWQQRGLWAAAVGMPTLYLWWADRTAIVTFGIWDISNAFSFDIDPLGLPIEEAVFFLVTNLMVVQGMMLFLQEVHLPILERFEKQTATPV